jgi:uncharacterized membrane protein YdjX (TVP38/TMEM64 family)
MTDQSTDPTKDAQGFSLKRSLPLVVLVALIGAAFYFDLHSYLSLQTIAENREALTGFVAGNILVAVATFVAVYIVVVALSLPGGALLTITGGFLFGPLLGGLATVVGATIGATIIFLIAKTSFGEPLAARAGPWLEKLSDGFRKDALSYLLFLRLVPAFPFWLVNLAPAVLGVGLGTYVIGTFVGIIPGTFAFAFVGAGLDSIIEAQQEAYNACIAEKGADGGCSFALDPGSLLTPEILIAFAALGVVALIPVVIRRLRDRKSAA